jgi:hypothetical protein
MEEKEYVSPWHYQYDWHQEKKIMDKKWRASKEAGFGEEEEEEEAEVGVEEEDVRGRNKGRTVG